MAAKFTLVDTFKVGNELGEGVVWDARKERVWWTDIEGKALFRRNFPNGEIERIALPDRLGSFGLLEDSDDAIVAAFAPGFARLDLKSGATDWIAKPLAPPYIRFNDGRVDRDGVFWAGTMVEGDAPPAGPRAALYRLDGPDAATRMVSDVGISNSLCWSPDGATAYFACSVARKIWAFDYQDGGLVNRRVFAETPEGVGPDGSTVDADGCLWNAEWGAGRVVRYTPDGRIDCTIELPVPHVTCVAFGGSDLSHLFVTSATQGLSEDAIKAAPQSGDLFVYETPFKGLPEPRCKL